MLSCRSVKTHLDLFSPEARAEQDLIRLYYVAYSAKYALIHLVPEYWVAYGIPAPRSGCAAAGCPGAK